MKPRRLSPLAALGTMSDAKTLTCPHCSDEIAIDLSDGDAICPSCEKEITMQRRQKRVRKRSGMRFGKTVYGVSAEGAKLESPKQAPFLGKKDKSKLSSQRDDNEAGGDEENKSSGTEKINRSRSGRRSRRIRNLIILASVLLVLAAVGAFAFRAIRPFLGTPKTVDAGVLGQSGASSSSPTEESRGELRVTEVYDRINNDILDENVESRIKLAESGEYTKQDRRGAPTPEDFSDAKKVAQKFIEASSFEESKRYMRDAISHADAISAYYEKHDHESLQYDQLSTLGIQDKNDNFTAFQVKKHGQPDRMIGLEKTPKGYLVDWASWVRYSEMDWLDFMSAKPVRPTLFRLMAKKSDYYNFSFKDAEVFQCYELISPEDTHPSLYGYVRKGSDMAIEFAKLDAISRGSYLPLVVRLRYPPGQDVHNMVVISELVSNGWLVRETVGSQSTAESLKGDL